LFCFVFKFRFFTTNFRLVVFFYHSSGSQVGRIDGERLYSASGSQMGRIDGERIYDTSGRQIGRVDGLRRMQIIIYFYFFM